MGEVIQNCTVCGKLFNKHVNRSCPYCAVYYDRLHSRKPAHDIECWSTGTIRSFNQQDGHCVVTVINEDDEYVELVAPRAIRDIFFSRLGIRDEESPVGEQIWYRKHSD